MVEQRLTKGMYNYNSKPVSHLFGLCDGQNHNRANSIMRNAGWYNKQGEKLNNSGDLSKADFLRIFKELRSDELFITLFEMDATLKFIMRKGVIDRVSGKKLKKEAPGVDYVAENCYYIIAKRQLYIVDRYKIFGKNHSRFGLEFKVLTSDTAKQLIFFHNFVRF